MSSESQIFHRFYTKFPRRHFVLLASFLLFAGLAGCEGTSEESSTDSQSTTLEEYHSTSTSVETDYSDVVTRADAVNAYNEFAIALYNFNASQENAKNLVVEPGSAALTLGMTLTGADAETAEQIRNVFSSQGSNRSLLEELRSGTLLDVVDPEGKTEGLFNKNAIWGQESYLFQTSFLAQLTSDYRSELHSLDFTVLGENFRPLIDSWASDFTMLNTINVAPASDTSQQTRLVLTSAMRLKSGWENISEVSLVDDGLFERLDGEQFWVPMVRWHGVYKTFSNPELSAVELPLVSGNCSLFVLMPTEGNFDALKEDLGARLTDVLQSLQPIDVDIRLPLLAISANDSLTEFLQGRGMIDAFDEETADFSKINGRGFAYLIGTRRSTTFSLNQIGAQAQGVTVASIEATADEPPDLFDYGAINVTTSIGCPSVYIDAGVPDARPFIYLIRHNETNAILYIGQLLDAGGEDAGHWECLWSSSEFNPAE